LDYNTYAIHPETKYEARPSALEACECSGLSGPCGGWGGLAFVDRPAPKSVLNLLPAAGLEGCSSMMADAFLLN